MNSADKIKQFFKDAELGINPDTDEKVFKDMQIAQQKLTKKVPAVPEIWRITMKSPLVKLTVAAVLMIACLTGYFMWTGTGSSIALGDVLARIEQVSVYMYEMSMSMSGQIVGDKRIDREMHATALMSQDHGMKLSTEMLDPNNGESMSQEMYILPQKKTVIMIMPGQKKYAKIDLDVTMVERTQEQNNDPRAMVEQILGCEYKSLGNSTINGIEVEGFQTTDPSYQGGAFGQVDVRIWVDVNTWLPVRSEMDMQMGEMQMHGVIYNFQWDVPVDAAEFEPVIPEDFTTLAGGPIQMPAINEETAIQGLKLHADLIGNYPEELNPVTLPSQIFKIVRSGTPAAKRLQEETKGFNQEERIQKLTEIILPIQGAGMFHTLLVQENKDPAYYGNIVTPEDSDLVLMRWKVSESEYRVIFGDLHAEMVDADVLAVLESALPK